MHENTQTSLWQLDSLAQHKIMVLYCTNIMVKEYSSRIGYLRNPHWVIRSPNPLIRSQLSKAYFKNTFLLQFFLFFINIMKLFSFFLIFNPHPFQVPSHCISHFFKNPHSKIWLSGNREPVIVFCPSSLIKTPDEK